MRFDEEVSDSRRSYCPARKLRVCVMDVHCRALSHLAQMCRRRLGRPAWADVPTVTGALLAG